MSFRVTSCHSYSSSLLHKKLEMPAGCKAKVKTIRINSLTIYDSFVRQIAQPVKFQCIFQLPSGQIQKFDISKSYCTLLNSKQVVGLSKDQVTVQINHKYSHHRSMPDDDINLTAVCAFLIIVSRYKLLKYQSPSDDEHKNKINKI